MQMYKTAHFWSHSHRLASFDPDVKLKHQSAQQNLRLTQWWRLVVHPSCEAHSQQETTEEEKNHQEAGQTAKGNCGYEAEDREETEETEGKSDGSQKSDKEG